jgi:hypothetical protein
MLAHSCRVLSDEPARARDVDLEERVDHVPARADVERRDDDAPLARDGRNLELGAG